MGIPRNRVWFTGEKCNAVTGQMGDKEFLPGLILPLP